MFKATKMGLLNFWNYDEEEYELYDGKILLRGQNGSGKTVTLQSFIPLILDGNKSPKRLDTFGGTDKHIDYYLLGEDKAESTGYLYMEFFNETNDKYITIGIGLNAKRGKQVDFWGFALTDGTRINKDFYLYKIKDGFNKTPLTKLELKTRLAGTLNRFVDTQREYKEMVNSLLFGFKNITAFDELINIILQIRSPKLSKEFKPTDLMKTLNEVLPPLAEADLMPLSDTIESLNSTKEKLDSLDSKINELNMFIKVFNNYNEAVLYNKAKKYQNKENSHKELLSKNEDLLSCKKDKEHEKEDLIKAIEELKLSYEKACMEKEQIDNSDIKKKKERQSKLEFDIKELENKIELDTNTLNSLSTKKTELERELSRLMSELNKIDEELKSYVNTIENQASIIHFDELSRYLSLVMTDELENYDVIKELIRNNEKEIERVRNIMIKRDEKIKELDDINVEIDAINAKYDELTKNYEELLMRQEIEKEKFIDYLVTINSNHKELSLNEDEIKDIIAQIKEFTLETYLAVKDKYQNIVSLIHESLIGEKTSVNSKLSSFKSELSIENEKLEDLKNKKEITLEPSSLEQDVQNLLESKKIPFIPLYKAIDFKDNLKSNEIDRIEANLLASGLLSAKIILEKDEDKIREMNIAYLLPSTKKKNNLTKYFKVTDEQIDFPKEQITKVLESISIDDKDEIFLNSKSYQFSSLKGHNITYKTKYIGYLSRKKEHERRIEEQENVVKVIQTKISSTENIIQSIDNKIITLKEESKDFPTNDSVKELDSLFKSNKLETDFILKEKYKLEERANNMSSDLKELDKSLNDVRSSSRIPLNLANYDQAYGICKVIRETFGDLKVSINKRDSIGKLIQSNKDHLNDSIKSYDDLFSNIGSLKEEIKTKSIEIESIKKFTETDDFKAISAKLDEINEIIGTYNDKSNKFSTRLGVIQNEILQANENAELLKKEIEESDSILKIYKSLLDEEIELGYIKNISSNNIDSILKNLASNNKDIAVARSNYYDGFNKYRQSLIDYNLVDTIIFKDKESEIKIYESKGISRDVLEEVYSLGARQDVQAIYENKKVNLYALLSALKDDYETNKIFLNEKDSYLFHDILLKTIGTKIKDKINEANKWVNDINDVMKEKQKYSNLSFHLSWSSKSKESLEEMDTRELVEIFKMDPDSVSPALTDKLIKHFKAKIAKREETMLDNKETYFDIISSILDYRNWYEFKLFYKKDGKDRKELTNKIFSVFSGGEKAKTMYIPLFASMSAKLQMADVNAPRLIAMDEAFAGVDDQNIEEMFGILASFDLDYVLTSQALWCDYSEVKDISICELIGDKKTNTIGVKRYRWNGIVRTSLDE